MRKKDEQWVIFYCDLLKPALFGEIEDSAIPAFLKKLSETDVVFPDGRRRRPGLSTLRKKLRKLKQRGIDALVRKVRKDRGHTRIPLPEMIAKAIEFKRNLPTRSVKTINCALKALYGRTLARATLYRHLKAAGATKLKLDVAKTKVRKKCRWDRTHAIWIGDFEHGPVVLDGDVARPTRLSAFIDGYSRFIVEARYYFREDYDVLVDCLLRAFAGHGAPESMYVDNAKVYHSDGLKLACIELHINLLHRPPKDPATGGGIERFFQTAQMQFENEVRNGQILTLDQLNRAFTAWLETQYHDWPHEGIENQTPSERYRQGLGLIRQVDLEGIIRFFMKRIQRTVHRTYSDVQLDCRCYRVDKRLRGDKVEVWWDPHGDKNTVLIYSLDEQYLGTGVLHDREQGESASEAVRPRAQHNMLLDLWVNQHEEKLQQESASGIDYRKALARRPYTFAAFAKKYAQLLGRRGGISAFSTDEMEALSKLYNRHPFLEEPLLVEAFARAGEKTIAGLAYELQILAQKRRKPHS